MNRLVLNKTTGFNNGESASTGATHDKDNSIGTLDANAGPSSHVHPAVEIRIIDTGVVDGTAPVGIDVWPGAAGVQVGTTCDSIGGTNTGSEDWNSGTD